VSIASFQLMFQGGFVGKTCQVLAWIDSNEFVDMMRFYPEDINPLQTFPVAEAEKQITSRVKIVFESSTDFFGRITVYKLDILGQDA
ncbi:Nuclear receptor 2C2-associated protein, partial [Linnemannia exigua]